MRLSTPFALAAVLVLALAGDALAFGRRGGCGPGGCSAQPRGGLLAGLRDRAQERRDARAGGCQQPQPVAFRPAPAAAYSAVNYGGCPGGVCSVR